MVDTAKTVAGKAVDVSDILDVAQGPNLKAVALPLGQLVDLARETSRRSWHRTFFALYWRTTT